MAFEVNKTGNISFRGETKTYIPGRTRKQSRQSLPVVVWLEEEFHHNGELFVEVYAICALKYLPLIRLTEAAL